MKRWILAILCGFLASPAIASDITVTRLVVRETAPGSSPVENRITVSRDFMRMDVVGDDSGFLLLDRKKHIVHNVNFDDNTDLLIEKGAISLAAPVPFEQKSIEQSGDKLPRISGHATRRYQISTNQTVCHDVVVIEDVLKDAAKAMMEFADVLSSEQAVGLAATPKEFVSECELATSVFEPGREYAKGFPVREQDWRGRLSELVDYDENLVVDSSLFSVPEGLNAITMQEMRGETAPQSSSPK